MKLLLALLLALSMGLVFSCSSEEVNDTTSASSSQWDSAVWDDSVWTE